MTKIGIGSQVWNFDANLRIYRKGFNGAPIWREHWRPMWIIGETTVSWLAGLTPNSTPKSGGVVKLRKRRAWPSSWAVDQAQIDELEWAINNRYKIVRVVEMLDAKSLRTVADLAGYSA